MPYEALAYYREEKPRSERQRGKMTGTPAMIRARYGKGWIYAHSCHPERPPGPEQWFYRTLEKAAE